jgi:hypothetical protein
LRLYVGDRLSEIGLDIGGLGARVLDDADNADVMNGTSDADNADADNATDGDEEADTDQGGWHRYAVHCHPPTRIMGLKGCRAWL